MNNFGNHIAYFHQPPLIIDSLKNVSVSTTDSDVVAFFAAVEGAGGTLSTQVKTAWSNFVLREKSAGRYAKIKRLYPYLGGVINSCLIDAITLNSATNNNFADGDCDAICGLQSDGLTKNILCDWSPSTLYSENHKWGGSAFWSSIDTSISTLNCACGSLTGTTFECQITYLRASSNVTIRGNSLSSVAAFSTTLTSNSSLSWNRTSPTNLKMSIKGTVVNTSTADDSLTGLSTVPMRLFANNNNGLAQLFSKILGLGHVFHENFSDAETQAFEFSYKTFLSELIAWDSDAKAYIDQLETDGSVFTFSFKKAYNDFVIAAKAAGVWYDHGLSYFYPLLGQNLTSVTREAGLHSSLINHGFLTGSVGTLGGLTSTGTEYLETPFNASDAGSVNSFGCGFFYKGLWDSAFQEMAIGATSGPNTVWLAKSNTNFAAFSVGTLNIVQTDDSLEDKSSLSVNRRLSNSISGFAGLNPKVSAIVNSHSLPAIPLFAFARNNGGTADNLATTTSVGLYFSNGWSNDQHISFLELYNAFLTSSGIL
jgi:hypothetical protein